MIVQRTVNFSVCVLFIALSYVECVHFGIHTPEVTADLNADSTSSGQAGGGSAGGNESGGFSVHIRGGFGVHGALAKILHVPASILGRVGSLQYKYGFLMPITLATQGTAKVSSLVQDLENVNSNSLSELISLYKQVIDNVVDGLVSAGVFQGKSTEQIINSIQNFATQTASRLMQSQNSLSAGLVERLKEVIDNLNIPKIRAKITSLPVIRDLVQFQQQIQMFISNNFQTQIDDVKTLVQSELDKNKDFIQPLSDAISSRILVVLNAAQALVNGNLDACPGDTSAVMSPTGSLQWLLNIRLDEIKLNLFQFLGLSQQAMAVQQQINELESEGGNGSPSASASASASVSAGTTSLPPVLTTLSGSASQTTEPPMSTPSGSSRSVTTQPSVEPPMATSPPETIAMTTPPPETMMTTPSPEPMMTTPPPVMIATTRTPSPEAMMTTTPSPEAMAMTTTPTPEAKMTTTPPPDAIMTTTPPPEPKAMTTQSPEAMMTTTPPPAAMMTTTPSPEAMAMTTTPTPEAKMTTTPPPDAIMTTTPPPEAKAMTTTQSPEAMMTTTPPPAAMITTPPPVAMAMTTTPTSPAETTTDSDEECVEEDDETTTIASSS